jgi:hypothetical protein
MNSRFVFAVRAGLIAALLLLSTVLVVGSVWNSCPCCAR